MVGHRIQTNMFIYKLFVRFGAGLLTGLLALLFFVTSLSPTVSAASVAQGYHSAQPIVSGTVVSLTRTGSSEVKATDYSNEQLIIGVAANSKDAIVDLRPSGSDVRVAISGEVSLLVTNSSGDIKAEDNLIISPITGVAMKDTSDNTAKKYIGVASESFSGATSGAKQVSIKVGDQDKNVYVGLIKAKILISDRQSSTTSPNPLLAFVQNLIGRKVSMVQLIGSVTVFLTTFSFTAFLLNGSIKGAFVSLGRNPLSKPAIVSNMVRVSALGLVILIAGIAMAYVILLI